MSALIPHDLEFVVSSRLGTLTAEATWAQLEQALRGLIADLPGADALQLRGARVLAETALKTLGVADARQVVADAFKMPTNGTGKASGSLLQGEAVTAQDVEAWGEEVDGDALLAAIVTVQAKYVWLPKGAATAIALWVLQTHCLDAFDVAPYLAITSPTKECGKTTEQRVLRGLVRRPVSTANLSPSALFRITQKLTPTLLIDEADTFARLSDDLRGILNAGHGRDDAVVIRSEGDDHEPRAFSVYGPKALSGIGDLPDTVQARSIVVVLHRKPAHVDVTRMRRRKLAAELLPLAQQCARWARDHVEELKGMEPVMPEGLSDRQADSWEPLIAIADAVGGRWPHRARDAARLLCQQGPEATQDIREQLLADLHAVWGERDEWFSADLVTKLVQLEGRPWPEFGRARKPLTQTGLARLLKPFGLAPKPLRQGDDVARGYTRAALAPVWAQYRLEGLTPPSTTVTPLQPSQDGPYRDFQTVTPSSSVTVAKPQISAPLLTCNAVTVQQGGLEAPRGDAWEPES